jgi:hypothetical protein
MDIIIILLAVVQSMAVSLGVGSSTIAIINFFTAIADGKIDEVERRMMGVVYKVLRVAMVLILITTGLLSAVQYVQYGVPYFSPFVVMFWVLISALFINALLMTKHIMPSKVGPALQAATWYSMGMMLALASVGIYGFTLLSFSIGYVVMIAFALGVVNAVMALLKAGKGQA